MSVKDYIERTRFFRTIQVYPTVEKLNVEGWLTNFSLAHQEVAARILDSFMYFDRRLTQRFLYEGITKALKHLQGLNPHMPFDEIMCRCIFSSVPGGRSNPTDSGNYMLRLARAHAHIPQAQIVAFEMLAGAISSQPLAVILLDDFLGSGDQFYSAWNFSDMVNEERCLQEIASSVSTSFIFVPLVANGAGVGYLQRECTDVTVIATHILGPEYDIFSPMAACWRGDTTLHQAGTSLLIEHSKALGHKVAEGEAGLEARGYKEQGLLLAFEHHIPDAVPPIFFWKENWTPLLNKEQF